MYFEVVLIYDEIGRDDRRDHETEMVKGKRKESNHRSRKPTVFVNMICRQELNYSVHWISMRGFVSKEIFS